MKKPSTKKPAARKATTDLRPKRSVKGGIKGNLGQKQKSWNPANF